ALDVWRYRTTAIDDATALSRMVARNTAAAVAFGDADAATDTLASLRERAAVTRACIYLPDGTRFAALSATATCPARTDLTSPETLPDAAPAWRGVIASAPIVSAGRTRGVVYVERGLLDLRGRLLWTASGGLVMFLLAALATYLPAERVHAA